MTLRILVVCTANVCRSPMAEALLRHHCAAHGVEAVVASAGTGAYGLPVDASAVQALGELGLDISHHQPRRVEPTMLEADGADLVLTMTREHVRSVATMVGGGFQRTFTLREFARRAAGVQPEPGQSFEQWVAALGAGRRASDLMGNDPTDDIADPYGLSLATHRTCAIELDALTEVAARAIASLGGPEH